MSKPRITHCEFINNINKLSINDNEKVFIITLFNKYFELGCRDNFYQYDDYLSAELNKTTRSIRNNRKSLQEKGYITCNHISKAGKQIVSYTINFEEIEKASKSITISKPTITPISNINSKGNFKTSGGLSPVKGISIPMENKVSKIACFGAITEGVDLEVNRELEMPQETPKKEDLRGVEEKQIKDITNREIIDNTAQKEVINENVELFNGEDNNNLENEDNTMRERKYYDTRYKYDYSQEKMMSILENFDVATVNAVQVKFEDDVKQPNTIDEIDLVVRYNCMYYITRFKEYQDIKAMGDYPMDILSELTTLQYKCIFDPKHNAYWDRSVRLVGEFMNINDLNYSVTSGNTQYSYKQEVYTSQEEVEEPQMMNKVEVEVITGNTTPDYYPECVGDIPDDIYNECTGIIFKEIRFDGFNEVGIINQLQKKVLRSRDEMIPLYKAYLNGGLYDKGYLKHCFKLAYDDVMLDKDKYSNVA